MIIITLTVKSGKLFDFTVNGNVAYGDNWFQNGTHNNGGWEVKESREDIRALIQEAINSKGTL